MFIKYYKAFKHKALALNYFTKFGTVTFLGICICPYVFLVWLL